MDGFSLTVAEAVCFGSSLAISGVCYYLYKTSLKTVEKLDDAPHFSIDKKLKDILKVTPGACLQYAAIKGVVRPVGEPLVSSFQKGVGVLQKFILTEHRLVWNSIIGTWMDSKRVVYQRMNAVPFVLVGSDETTVKVLCPLQASGVNMETTYEKFRQVNYGLSDLLLQYLSGQKPKGQLETEEMLKVGAVLTGVGKLILETDGTLNLGPPSNGSQYFLSITDFDSLRGAQNSSAVWWKALAMGFALAGSAVLLWVGRRFCYHLKAQWDREQERRNFERLQAQAPMTHALRDPEAPQDDDQDQIENACVICTTQPRNCILLECGHVCCCHNCYLALPQRQCPICRQIISRVVPLYQS